MNTKDSYLPNPSRGNEVVEARTETQRDLWFNPHLGPDSQRAQLAIGGAVAAVTDHKRKRALSAKNLNTFYRTVIALLANLIHHYLIGCPGDGIPVPRSKKLLGLKPNRYQPSFPRSLPRILDALRELGFAREKTGEYSGLPSKSKMTTVRAGPKLIALIKEHKLTLEDISGSNEEEIIILKRPRRGHWDEGERVNYSDNDKTHRLRSEVRDLNAWLARADITFDPAAYDRPVNARLRQLRRIFTLGRFDRGGRLFGGFWQLLPKPVRLMGIRIDGEAVVGLDYSQTNPILAYHLANAEPQGGDAYTLPGFEEYREGVKHVFNAMLNHPLERFPKGTRKSFPRRISFEDLSAAILQRHPKLKGILSNAEIGHRLQYLESEIMMRVLRQCREHSVVALPVFDCVVVKASAESVVRKIMCREFEAVSGLEVTVKREMPLPKTSQRPFPTELGSRSGL
jgi:hypothetical protein